MLDGKRWRCVVECEVLEKRIVAISHAVTDLGASVGEFDQYAAELR
jgi:hypothetical protein